MDSRRIVARPFRLGTARSLCQGGHGSRGGDDRGHFRCSWIDEDPEHWMIHDVAPPTKTKSATYHTVKCVDGIAVPTAHASANIHADPRFQI